MLVKRRGMKLNILPDLGSYERVEFGIDLHEFHQARLTNQNITDMVEDLKW